MNKFSKTMIGITLSLAVPAIVIADSADNHFDPKGKLPSKYTVEFQQKLRSSLPFEDQRDFEEMKKGFIAAPKYREIMADTGHVARSIGKYDFLLFN